MKEAAGEANLTVVAIILIGVVVAVATPLINSLMSSSAKKHVVQMLVVYGVVILVKLPLVITEVIVLHNITHVFEMRKVTNKINICLSFNDYCYGNR